MAQPIHHLEVVVEFARAIVRLNGLPLAVVAARDETRASFAPPVNPYLAGARNVVEIVLDASVGFDKKPLPFQRAGLELTVRRYEKGGIVEPGGGDLVTRYVPPPTLLADVAQGKRKPPITLTHPFANQAVDFSPELLDAKPFADEEALRDYAMKLRSLAVKRDVSGLLAEYEPKLRVWSTAYAEPYAMFADSMRDQLTEFIAVGADVAFTRDDVEPQSFCGGRIWELRRKRGVPLLRSLPGSEGERTELSAFVAPREGALRIVR